MANDIWKEPQQVRSWIQGNYIYHECPTCGRTHKCHTAVEPEPEDRPSPVSYKRGDQVIFLGDTKGASRDGSISIKKGETAQVIEDREMDPGRHRLFVTLHANGQDCWVAASMVGPY